MGKLKIHFKMLQEQTGALEEVSKIIIGHADTMEDISNKLENDPTLQDIKGKLKSGATQLREYNQGLAAMKEAMTACIECYTRTENDSVSKVDNCRAHKRDFYKRAVSVPSPGGVGSGGGGGGTATAATVVNVEAPAVAPTGATVTGGTAPAASSPMGGTIPVSSTSGGGAAAMGGSASSGAASTSMPRPVSGAGGGANMGTVGAVAAGVAGVGAVAAGVGAAVSASKKKKMQAAQEGEQADLELMEAERKLQEAMANANSFAEE